MPATNKHAIFAPNFILVITKETKALKQLSTFLPLKRMLIVTYDEEGTIPIDNGKQIDVVPAWKWLLEDVLPQPTGHHR